jgi:hypothetical protein
VRNFLFPVQQSDLIDRIYQWTQTSMNAKYSTSFVGCCSTRIARSTCAGGTGASGRR